MEVIETDRIFDIPGGQFLPGNGIDILLERGENGLGHGDTIVTKGYQKLYNGAKVSYNIGQ